MSALASLERFGEEDLVFINWRSCLQNEWPLICVSYWISAKRKVELLAAQSCSGHPPHSGRIGRSLDGCARCALKAISHYSVASLVHCINCIVVVVAATKIAAQLPKIGCPDGGARRRQHDSQQNQIAKTRQKWNLKWFKWFDKFWI